MDYIPKRTLLFSGQLFLIGFLFSHVAIPNDWFYTGLGGALIALLFVSLAVVYLLLTEMRKMIAHYTNASV